MEEEGYLCCENFLDYSILYKVYLTDLKFFTWNMPFFFFVINSVLDLERKQLESWKTLKYNLAISEGILSVSWLKASIMFHKLKYAIAKSTQKQVLKNRYSAFV